jgi:hypothetical protein
MSRDQECRGELPACGGTIGVWMPIVYSARCGLLRHN